MYIGYIDRYNITKHINIGIIEPSKIPLVVFLLMVVISDVSYQSRVGLRRSIS